LSDLYIGTDIVDVKRIKASVDNYSARFINKVFSQEEQSYCNSKSNPEIHYSGRFAAKEAIIKAMKSSGFEQKISLKDIVIINNNDGSPYVKLDFNYQGEIKVSISHTHTHAVAFAILKINP